MNKEITFEVPIYLDTLKLLLSDKTDILEEVKYQIAQGDPALENIREELNDLVVETQGADRIMNAFDDDSLETLMCYISYDEDKIKYNYDEASEVSDRRLAVFSVPCKFNAEGYIKNHKAM